MQAVAAAERDTLSSPGTYYLVGPDLRVDAYLSRIFQMAKFRLLSPSTQDSYVKDIRAFFDFLDLRGKGWNQAEIADVEDWEFWRTASPENPKRIGPSKWTREYAAILKVYSLAHRIGASSLAGELRLRRSESGELPSRSPKRAAKWLPPDHLRQWRDVGLRGFEWDGSERSDASPRMSDRNAAFVDLLLGTGLRSAEAHALTVLEVPEESELGETIAVLLPAGIAKGRVNERLFYLDRVTLSSLKTYISLSRRTAIRRANGRKAYDSVANKLTVTAVSGQRDPMLTYFTSGGGTSKRKLSTFSLEERERLFDGRGKELAPLALWLSQDGTPLTLRSWQGVFEAANERCALGSPTDHQAIYCHPHMLRHSFAMVKLLQFRIAIDRRYGLGVADRRDNEARYSSAYDAVRDLLGHSSSLTTRKVYLASLRDLEVEALLSEVAVMGDPNPFKNPNDVVGQMVSGI